MSTVISYNTKGTGSSITASPPIVISGGNATLSINSPLYLNNDVLSVNIDDTLIVSPLGKLGTNPNTSIPSITGNANKFLSNDGTTLQWATNSFDPSLYVLKKNPVITGTVTWDNYILTQTDSILEVRDISNNILLALNYDGNVYMKGTILQWFYSVDQTEVIDQTKGLKS